MERLNKLRELQKSSPNDSFLKHALALEYIKIGEDGEARSLFESILQHEPGYVGSYYQLAKLLERTGDTGEAIMVYKKGMEAARNAGDNHTYSELRGACEELEF